MRKSAIYISMLVAALFCIAFFSVNSYAATSTVGYRTEKTISSTGGSISIKGLNYNVIIGNKGNRIKLERENYSTFMSYPSCRMINDTQVCFTQNLTKGVIKISIDPKYGKLEYKIVRSIPSNNIQVYVGQQINVTVNFSNTGNMTIFPRYIDALNDFYITECDNCIIEDNKVIFNKSIEPDDLETFSYKIIPEKKFKKTEKTPALEFFDGVERKVPKMDKIYYEALESFLKVINITAGDMEISDRANITVFINNTLKNKKMNYTLSFKIPKDIEIIDSNKFQKDSSRYYYKGTIKNGSTVRHLFEIKFKKTGLNIIPVTLAMKNTVINYERTYNITKIISFLKKPTVEYRMKEYVIGKNSPHTLQVFLGNQDDFKLKNITVKLITYEKNYTQNFPEVDGVDEVASFDFYNASGKKVVMINTTYYTEYGEAFWIFDTKEMLFPEKIDDKINISDTTNKNLTPDIKKNVTNNNSTNNNNGKIDVEIPKVENFFKDKSIFILLAFVPLIGLIIFIIIGKLSSTKQKKAEESAEKELVSEIEKLRDELEKREKNV